MKALFAIMLFLAMATMFSMAEDAKVKNADAVPKTCTSDERITKYKPTDADELKACNVYYYCLKALKGQAPRKRTCRGGYFKHEGAKCVRDTKCPNSADDTKDKDTKKDDKAKTTDKDTKKDDKAKTTDKDTKKDDKAKTSDKDTKKDDKAKTTDKDTKKDEKAKTTDKDAKDKVKKANAVPKTCTSDESITLYKPTDADELKACNVYYKCLKALKGKPPMKDRCNGGYFKHEGAKCVQATKCPN